MVHPARLSRVTLADVPCGSAVHHDHHRDGSDAAPTPRLSPPISVARGQGLIPGTGLPHRTFSVFNKFLKIKRLYIQILFSCSECTFPL